MRSNATVRRVVAAMRPLLDTAGYDPTAAAVTIDATISYLQKLHHQFRYAMFWAAVYSIDSGCIESVNKLAVDAYLKGSRMHWVPAHMHLMLALRTGICSDSHDEAWPCITAHLRDDGSHGQHGRRVD